MKLTEYCRFVQPSIDAHALWVRDSSATKSWELFRDIIFALLEFVEKKSLLETRKHPLACVVLRVDSMPDVNSVAEVFSMIRIAVIANQITMGLMPGGAAILAEQRIIQQEGSESLVVIRSKLESDSRFRAHITSDAVNAHSKLLHKFLAAEAKVPDVTNTGKWQEEYNSHVAEVGELCFRVPHGQCCL